MLLLYGWSEIYYYNTMGLKLEHVLGILEQTDIGP